MNATLNAVDRLSWYIRRDAPHSSGNEAQILPLRRNPSLKIPLRQNHGSVATKCHLLCAPHHSVLPIALRLLVSCEAKE